MANLFNVNDRVVCQKRGGQSGNKPLTPAFAGTVKSVLPGGTSYVVAFDKPAVRQPDPSTYFVDSVALEEHMVAE